MHSKQKLCVKTEHLLFVWRIPYLYQSQNFGDFRLITHPLIEDIHHISDHTIRTFNHLPTFQKGVVVGEHQLASLLNNLCHLEGAKLVAFIIQKICRQKRSKSP